MSKRTYKKVQINKFNAKQLADSIRSERVVVAVDVAKTDMVTAFTGDDGVVSATVAWTSPHQSDAFYAVLGTLQGEGKQVEMVMESTGTYGDALRHGLYRRGYPVFRVSAKRTHDAAEVYDGVASLHDAKSAAIIAKLHVDGRSHRWEEDSDEHRRHRALVNTMDLYQSMLQRLQGQLEAQLARYWPEVTELVQLKSATLLALLARIGGPEQVAADPNKSRRLMQGMSKRLMSDDKIDLIIVSAETSVGVPMVASELDVLKRIAGEAHRILKEVKAARRYVEELTEQGPGRHLATVVGKATAAVLMTDAGDPTKYVASRAYLKALGLNLKEKSSGKQQGALRISKRGPGRARRYLWMAVLRWIQTDAIARAWYEKKVKRDGGKKMRAIMALVRKLAKALYHVGRGAVFDSRKLFDVSRLELSGTSR